MTEIEQLKNIDKILDEISKSVFGISDIDLVNKLKKDGSYYKNLYYINLTSIIETLIEDGHITSTKLEMKDFSGSHLYWFNQLKTTLTGKNFYARGSYYGDYERALEIQKRKEEINSSQLQMRNLTCWIAVGTSVAALYYLLEMIRIWILPHLTCK